MATATTHPMIVKTPGTCGGRPRIDGHRIRVRDIVDLYVKRGLSAEEVAEAYPSITLAQIHAALAYYHDFQEEIEADIRDDDRFIEQFIREHPESVIRWGSC